MRAEIFELLFNSAEIAKFTPEERVKYEYDMTTERDIRNQIAYSREEGREEERRLIANALKERGFSEQDIASIMSYER